MGWDTLILAHSLSRSVDLGRVEQIDPVLVRQSHQLLSHLSQRMEKEEGTVIQGAAVYSIIKTCTVHCSASHVTRVLG